MICKPDCLQPPALIGCIVADYVPLRDAFKRERVRMQTYLTTGVRHRKPPAKWRPGSTLNDNLAYKQVFYEDR